MTVNTTQRRGNPDVQEIARANVRTGHTTRITVSTGVSCEVNGENVSGMLAHGAPISASRSERITSSVIGRSSTCAYTCWLADAIRIFVCRNGISEQFLSLRIRMSSCSEDGCSSLAVSHTPVEQSNSRKTRPSVFWQITAPMLLAQVPPRMNMVITKTKM